MEFKDLKLGQHLWVLKDGKLLMVAKINSDCYEVCGAWECGIDYENCEIIELVDVPKGYENTERYYTETKIWD